MSMSLFVASLPMVLGWISSETRYAPHFLCVTEWPSKRWLFQLSKRENGVKGCALLMDVAHVKLAEFGDLTECSIVSVCHEW